MSRFIEVGEIVIDRNVVEFVSPVIKQRSDDYFEIHTNTGHIYRINKVNESTTLEKEREKLIYRLS